MRLPSEVIDNMYKRHMSYQEVVEEIKKYGLSKKEAIVELAEIAIVSQEFARTFIRSYW